MLVVFERNTMHIKAIFSDDQKIEVIYRNSPQVLDRLDGIYIDDEYIPKSNITNYKFNENWEIVKASTEEFPQSVKSSTVKKLESLQQENVLLYSAIAELSMLLGSAS